MPRSSWMFPVLYSNEYHFRWMFVYIWGLFSSEHEAFWLILSLKSWSFGSFFCLNKRAYMDEGNHNTSKGISIAAYSFCRVPRFLQVKFFCNYRGNTNYLKYHNLQGNGKSQNELMKALAKQKLMVSFHLI